MSRRLIAIAAVALLALTGSASGAVLPSLYVNYREDCTFRLTDDAGATVTAVAPSIDYQVVVATPAPFAGIYHPGANDLVGCNGNVKFHLSGPGVSVTTTLDGGDGAHEVYSVKFEAGASYTIQDDSNVNGTRRTLVASGSPPPAVSNPSSTGLKPVPKPTPIDRTLRGTLTGAVTTTGKLALTLKSKPVTTLRSGRYKLTVLDETGRSAFLLQQRGKKVTTITSKEYLGRRTITVTLAPGQWTYYSTTARKRSFVVTG